MIKKYSLDEWTHFKGFDWLDDNFGYFLQNLGATIAGGSLIRAVTTGNIADSFDPTKMGNIETIAQLYEAKMKKRKERKQRKRMNKIENKRKKRIRREKREEVRIRGEEKRIRREVRKEYERRAE